MRALFKTFEEKSRLVKILNACLADSGVRVVIGHENPDPELRDLALVTARLPGRRRAGWGVGVMGSTRMEYARVVTLVDHMARALSRALGDRASERREDGRTTGNGRASASPEPAARGHGRGARGERSRGAARAAADARGVEALEREKDELKDQLLRKRADFENYRKRVERDRQQAGLDAAAAVFRALIPTPRQPRPRARGARATGRRCAQASSSSAASCWPCSRSQGVVDRRIPSASRSTPRTTRRCRTSRPRATPRGPWSRSSAGLLLQGSAAAAGPRQGREGTPTRGTQRTRKVYTGRSSLGPGRPGRPRQLRRR